MRKFSIKRFISIILFFTLIMITLSGIVLWIMPHGRIAYWLNWSLLGLGKSGWESVHIGFAIVMVAGCIFHLFVYNWRSFTGYLRKRKEAGKLSGELYAACGVFILFFVLSVLELPPLSNLISAVDRVKESWISEDLKPPFPHAELMSIAELCERENIPVDLAMKRINERGIRIKGAKQNIAFVARDNKVSAREVFLVMKGVE